MTRRYVFSAVGLLVLLARAAVADVLFVDLNFSEREINAAREAARARGEALIVLPVIAPEIRANLQRLKREYLKVQKEYNAKLSELTRMKINKAPADKVASFSESIQPLKQRADRVREAYSTERQRQRIDIAQSLRGELRRQSATHGKVTSLIVSSHHAAGEFIGEAGTIRTAALTEVLQENSSALGDHRSLYLWGCYTGTQDVVSYWKEKFPNLKIIAGYDDRAPSGSLAASGDLLRALMVDEAKIVGRVAQTKDSRQALDALKSVYKGLPGTAETTAAMCTSNYYVSHRALKVLDGTESCDPALVAQAEAGHKVFSQYRDAGRGFEDVPTDVPTSALRTYYAFLNQNSHCKELKSFVAEKAAVIRLILFKNILKNFALYFKAPLEELNHRCEIMPEFLRRPCIPDLTKPQVWRSDVLRAIDRLPGAREKKSEQRSRWQKLFGLGSSEKPEDATRLEKFAEASRETRTRLVKMLKDLECIPMDWIEPADSRDQLTAPDSRCLQ